MKLAVAMLVAVEAVSSGPKFCSEPEITIEQEFFDALRSPVFDDGSVSARRWVKHRLSVEVGSDDQNQLPPGVFVHRWLQVVTGLASINIGTGFTVGLMPGTHPVEQKSDIVVVFASRSSMVRVRAASLNSDMSGDGKCLAIVDERRAVATVPVEAGAVFVASDATDAEITECVRVGIWRILGLFDLKINEDWDKSLLFFRTLYLIEVLTKPGLEQALRGSVKDYCGRN